MSRSRLAAHWVTIGYPLDFVTLGEQDALAEGVTSVCPIRFGLVFTGGPR